MQNKRKMKYAFKDSAQSYNYEIIEGANLIKLKNKFINKNSEYGEESYNNIYLPNISNVTACINNSNNKLTKILLFGDVQSGKTNNMIFLVSQLKDLGFKKFILLTGTKNVLNNQNLGRFIEYNEEKTFLPFVNESSFFTNDDSTQFLYGIKQNIGNVWKNIENRNIDDLDKLDIVILDDEADEASAEKERDKPIINTYIENILKSGFKKILYISITATPYANIMTYTDFLKPDFVIPLKSSYNYTGGQIFKNKERYFIIPDDICDLFKDNIENQKINDFIDDCIASFIAQSFYDNKPYQFLVNVHIDTTKISKLAKMFDERLSLLRARDKEYLSKYIREDDYINFLVFSNKVKVKEYYSGSNYKRGDAPEIIIGGLLLSRGVTFDYLLFEIMLNAPKNDFRSDTLLQRARWYGYRGKHIEKMKIFVSERIKKFYINITDAENDIKKLYTENKFDNKTTKTITQLREIFNKYKGSWD